ncbi:MAG: DUF1687 domain-containing protein [Herbaspirillum sp.]
MLTIYHNPHCSKSRAALTMLQEFSEQHQQPLQIIEYLKTPPSVTQLQTLLHQLDAPLETMLRQTEPDYQRLNLDDADATTVFNAIQTCPRLLQRPLVTDQSRTIMARNADDLTSWLKELEK